MAFGFIQVFFNCDYFLLIDKIMLVIQRLGVLCRISIVISYIFMYNFGCVFGNIQIGFKMVLQMYVSDVFWVDCILGWVIGINYRCSLIGES